MINRFLSGFRRIGPAPVLTSVIKETDDSITIGRQVYDSNFRDRLSYDRGTLLTAILNLYRSNPIAKRIVEITTEFAIGDGFSFAIEGSARAEKFAREFWDHPLNDLSTQLPEWADEAWRTGDLFLLVSVDLAGMCYVRAIPAESISEIVTAENDYRQELAYKRSSFDEQPYQAYKAGAEQKTFLLHYPLNRMVGTVFGESDLQTVRYWINRYTDFLENRARLNFFRQLFSFVLQKNFQSQAEKESYVRSFAAALPKKSGGVLALSTDEVLGVINPQLASFEAETDAVMIKRMISTGSGLPMHYLSEPESATRTTAEAAGTPTFKRFKRRQQFLVHAVYNILQVALEVRRTHDSRIPRRPVIKVIVPDITERDNATLGMAVQRVTAAFIPLYNAKKITARELIRLVYKFLAEAPPDEIPDEESLIDVKGGAAAQPVGAPPAEPDPNADPAAAP